MRLAAEDTNNAEPKAVVPGVAPGGIAWYSVLVPHTRRSFPRSSDRPHTMADSSTSPPRDGPAPVDAKRTSNPFADIEKGTNTAELESDFEAAPTIVDSDRLSTRDGGNGEKGAAAAEWEARDVADIVDWDGPTDVENPQNWPEKKKWTLVAVLSIMTLVT